MIIFLTRSSERKGRSHLGYEVCGSCTESLQHGRGFGVEQRHSIGHLVVDLVLNVQLQAAGGMNE